ncbi:hypothetical protein ACWENQ_44725 [Nonomuraea sp. NPDC004354]
MPSEREQDSSERPPREPVSKDAMVAALLREREGYVQRGLAERVAEVDEQLKLRGHAPPKSNTPPNSETTGEATGGKPRGRRAPGKSRT